MPVIDASTAGALVDGFQSAVLEAARCANPGTEQEHRAHDRAQDALVSANAQLVLAVGVLAWNKEPESIPFDMPVLVMKKGGKVPFMAVRSKDYEPDTVDCLLQDDARGYGIRTDIDELERWATVLDQF